MSKDSLDLHLRTYTHSHASLHKSHICHSEIKTCLVWQLQVSKTVINWGLTLLFFINRKKIFNLTYSVLLLILPLSSVNSPNIFMQKKKKKKTNEESKTSLTGHPYAPVIPFYFKFGMFSCSQQLFFFALVSQPVFQASLHVSSVHFKSTSVTTGTHDTSVFRRICRNIPLPQQSLSRSSTHIILP